MECDLGEWRVVFEFSLCCHDYHTHVLKYVRIWNMCTVTPLSIMPDLICKLSGPT